MSNEVSNEESDYVSTAERHERIIQDGDSTAKMLGYVLVFTIALILFTCLLFTEFIIGKIS